MSLEWNSIKGRFELTVPVQVSWSGPRERHLKALDDFYEEHPRSSGAVFVTAESYASGLLDLPGSRLNEF